MWTRLLPSLLIVVAFVPSVARAISISEIMFDVSGSDTGREWIELYNDTNIPLDITGWRLLENGTRHKILPLNGPIPPNGYGVIASTPDKFRADWPQYTGPLFDSSFSLSNAGEKLVIENASSTVVAEATYIGGKANGNGLSFVEGAWVFRKPTPGSTASPDVFEVVALKKPAVAGNVSVGSGVPRKSQSTPAVEQMAATGNAPVESRGLGIIPWIVGLLAIMGVGIGILFVMPTRKSGSGYTIIEDNS